MSKKGTRIGPYEILEKIGQGGMGVVYRAREDRLQRDVALKVLPERMASDASFAKRFIREAQAAARIEHPGIVSIFGAGQENDTFWIAMQLVSGQPFSERIRSGPLPPDDVLNVARNVAEALDHAHRLGVIHRDIKPDNIMIDQEGRVKIMDFGLAKAEAFDAKITESGVFLGTPEYSSPEQCESQDVDGRSDLYSLGVVLYEALTGQVPHSAETPYSLFKKIVDDPPTPIRDINPDVPSTVAALVDRLMHKDREKRYQTARELINDIDKIRGLPPTALASGDDTAYLEPGGGTTRSRAFPLLGLGAAALLVLAALAVILALGTRSPDGGNGNGSTDPATPANTDAPSAPAPAPGETERPVVAVVVDFKNLADSQTLSWMRVGVPDMLITDLAQLEWLRLRSRDRIIADQAELGIRTLEEPGALARLADALDADILIKGSFVAVGGKVKIDIQVLAHPGEDLILSDHITGTLDEILSMVDKLTVRIRRGLEARFGPPEGEDLTEGEEMVSLARRLVEVSAHLDRDKSLGGIAGNLEADNRTIDDLLTELRAHISVTDGKAEKQKRRAGGSQEGRELPESASATGAPRPSGSPAPEPAADGGPGYASHESKKGKRAKETKREPLREAKTEAEAEEREADAPGSESDAAPGAPREAGKKAFVEKAMKKLARLKQAEKARKEEAERDAEKLDDELLGKKPGSTKGAAAVEGPANPMIRAMILVYRSREIRERAGADVKALLQSASLLKKALQIHPGLATAHREMADILRELEALQETD